LASGSFTKRHCAGENGAGNLSFVFNPRFGAWFCEVEQYNDFGFAQMESLAHFDSVII
jgi:hypothetical protein